MNVFYRSLLTLYFTYKILKKNTHIRKVRQNCVDGLSMYVIAVFFERSKEK